MAKITAREYAQLALEEILLNDAYSNITLNKLFSNDDINDNDKGYITELVYGTIKNKIYLEHILKHYAKSRVKPKVKIIIISAIYQILYMDRTPNFATVNEAVNIAKKTYGQTVSRFVNGVLRNVIRTFNPDILKYKNSEEKFLIEHSCPEPLYKSLSNQYGTERAKNIIVSFNTKSNNSIRVNTSKINRADLVERLQEATTVKISELCEDSLLIDKINFNSLEFKDGLFTIQDEASALVACTINKDFTKNYNILDVCAAPGGKSLHIAEKYFNSNIVSCDKYIHKLSLINSNAKRLGIENINIVEQDATIINPKFIDKFDIVICDVPCSGIGVIKNKPEIKYKITDSYIEEIAKVQSEILEVSRNYVKKGGLLIYSTCTIDKRENIDNISAFLQKNKNFSREKIQINSLIKEDTGIITILPDEYDCDGFFIAKLIKKEN